MPSRRLCAHQDAPRGYLWALGMGAIFVLLFLLLISWNVSTTSICILCGGAVWAGGGGLLMGGWRRLVLLLKI